MFREFDLDPGTVVLFGGAGCPDCNFSGYRGRIAIYEVLPFREALKELIFERASAAEIRKKARTLGMMTLRETGINKVIAGVTTLEEVLRITERE